MSTTQCLKVQSLREGEREWQVERECVCGIFRRGSGIFWIRVYGGTTYTLHSKGPIRHIGTACDNGATIRGATSCGLREGQDQRSGDTAEQGVTGRRNSPRT